MEGGNVTKCKKKTQKPFFDVKIYTEMILKVSFLKLGDDDILLF
jgi:hypothetical protein